MKKTRLSAVAIAALSAGFALPVSGAAFISDLSGLGTGNLHGYNDSGTPWTVSATGLDGLPLAYGANVGGNYGFQLGVAQDIPSAGETSFYASHTVSVPLSSTTLTTQFRIVDSTAAYPERNDYTIAIYDALSNRLFSLDMTAIDQDVPGGASDQWNVAWNTGNSANTAFAGVLEDGFYTLTVGFTPNGADIDFSLSLSGINTFTQTGTLTGLAAADVASYRVGTSIGTGADWGNGVIGITGIGVIPEPSVMLLGFISGFGLLRRRR